MAADRLAHDSASFQSRAISPWQRRRQPPSASRPSASEPKRTRRRSSDPVADRLDHPPDLAVAAFAQDDLDLASPSRRHLGRRRRPVLELDPAPQPLEVAVAERRPQPRPVGLGDPVAGVGEPVGELAVVGQQQQPGRVGVEAADRVEPRFGVDQRRPPPAAPPARFAVETTPAGLFTAQTSCASTPTGLPSTRTSSSSPTSRAGSVTTFAADRDPPVGDDLLGLPPRGDAAVGEVLGEAHAVRADERAHGSARCSPALSRRSRSSRSSSGLGSKRAGSGSWSSPARPKSRSNSSEVLKIAAPNCERPGLLDQAALGQASAPPTPRRRRGCGRSPAARPAAGRRRSPASRPGPGSAAASAASPAGAAPPPRWPGRWRGRSRRRPRAGRSRACPRRGPRAAARSPRRPGPRSPRSPRARSAAATGCGERKSSASTVRVRSLTRPPPCGPGSGRTAPSCSQVDLALAVELEQGEDVTAWVSRSSPPNSSSKSKLVRRPRTSRRARRRRSSETVGRMWLMSTSGGSVSRSPRAAPSASGS